MGHSLHTKKLWRDRFKELKCMEQASIAKLLWYIAQKKDMLWVKWVHWKCLKQKDWWDYLPPPDCSWYWKKLVISTKELFEQGVSKRATWTWQGHQAYSVKASYTWLMGRPCLLYTSPSPRDGLLSRMPSSA